MSAILTPASSSDQIPRTYISAPWPRRPAASVLLVPPFAKLAANGGVPVCMVRTIVNDSVDGTPVQGAVVEFVLSGFDVDDGYVAPLKVTVYTDEFGEAFVSLWPNELGAVETVYNVKIIANGKTLRLTAAVPNAPEADLHLIAQLPPWPGQSQGSFVSGEVYDWMLRAEKAAQDAEQAAAESGVKDAEVDANGDLIITRGDDSTINAGHVTGAPGPAGPQGPAGDAGAGASADTQVLFNQAGLVVGDPKMTFAKTVPALRLYNLFTDASNYERLSIGFNANVARIASEAAGSGTQRNMSVYTAATLGIYNSANVAKLFLSSGATSGYFDLYRVNDGAGNAEYLRIGSTGTASFVIDATMIGTGVGQPMTVGTSGSANLAFKTGNTTRFYFDGATGNYLPQTTALYNIGAAAQRVATVFSATENINGGVLEGAANVLEQRNGATAQRFSVYNTYTDASNYERASLRWASGEMRLGLEALGTGVLTRQMGIDARAINYRDPNAASALMAQLDLANKVFYLYNAPSPDYERLSISWSGSVMQFVTQAGGTGVGRNISIIPGAGSTQLSLGCNAASKWLVQDTKLVPAATATHDIGQTSLRVNKLWSVDGDFSGTIVATVGLNIAAANNLTSDGGNALAIRNLTTPTTAQALRIYNTYTDASNYERGHLYWSSNVLTLQTAMLGTGVARGMKFDAGTTIIFAQAGVTKWFIDANGHFTAPTDNTLDIGLQSSQRPRVGYFATGVYTATLTVATLPAAASANQGMRCFVNDSTVVAAGNFGNVVAGAGANKVPVYSDGAAWRIG